MYLKIRDLDLNYEIKGNGKPIVILHGYTVDDRLMSGCIEPILGESNEYKRIYIDLPGMGKTKSKDWIVNSDVMLDIVIEVIDKIIPDENFLLAGESYGGYLSLGLIYKMKERVDGLFLLCPATKGHDLRHKHIVLKKDDELLSKLDKEEAEMFRSIQVVQTEETWTRYSNEILSGIKLADNDFLNKLNKCGKKLSFEKDMFDQKFNKPTLFLLGRQDSSVGYKGTWSILDNYPRATFAVLDMAGHNLQIEQPEVFNALFSEWIKRVSYE
nr:alpha/beta hydrolase [Clostridium neonatale]